MTTTTISDITPLQLLSPPAASTDTSIALVWDAPQNSVQVGSYQIYVNGRLYGICNQADYTLTDLDCSTEYQVFVRAVTPDGVLSEPSNSIQVRTKRKAELFDITDYGAKADDQAINTEAIQAAIDACSPGGKVYVPAGTFVTGALFLKSNMTLFIERGGRLLGSDDPAHYPLMQYRWEGKEQLCYASLINTRDCDEGRLEHITIEGDGTIDANGARLKVNEIEEAQGHRGRAICLRNVDYIYLKDITVRQSPAWCVHLIFSNHISVNNAKIHSKYDEYGRQYSNIINGDGLNPDSSSDIYIFNSMISSQDDCIAIKSGFNEEGRRVGIPSQDIRITNCTFKSGFGVAIGSEMAGSVRNVLVKDCRFEDVYSIATIKSPRGRGAVIENIRYENCSLRNYSLEHTDCQWFRGAINIDQFYSHTEFDVSKLEPVNEGTSVIRNIVLKNITLDTKAGNAVFMAGLPESPLQNIKLENVQALGKYGLKAYNIKGLEMNHVMVQSRLDQDYVFNNTEKLEK